MTTKKPATMVIPEGGSPTGVTIEESPIETDLNMGEAGETNGMVGDVSGESIRVTHKAANEQLEQKENGKRLRSEILEVSGAPGDWRSYMERTISQ